MIATWMLREGFAFLQHPSSARSILEDARAYRWPGVLSFAGGAKARAGRLACAIMAVP